MSVGKKELLCSNCRKRVSYHIFKRPAKTIIKDIEIKYEEYYGICGRDYIDEHFHGSLPMFISAFCGNGVKLSDKDKEWQGKLDAMAFDGKIKDAITAAKGKSAKAISALLDMDTLRASKNQDADIKTALEALKKDSGYLFEDEQIPPHYAPGTGTHGSQTGGAPESLAGALRAKYNIT